MTLKRGFLLGRLVELAHQEEKRLEGFVSIGGQEGRSCAEFQYTSNLFFQVFAGGRDCLRPSGVEVERSGKVLSSGSVLCCKSSVGVHSVVHFNF